MKNEFWFKPELDLDSALKKRKYDELVEYTEENRRQVLSQWKRNNMEKLEKSLRLGSALLSFQEEKLKKEKRQFTIFNLGKLYGTIDTLGQLFYIKRKNSTNSINDEYIKKADLLKLIEKNRPINWIDSEAKNQADMDYEKYFEMIKNFPAAENVVQIKNCKQCKHAFDNPVYFDGSPCKRCSNHYENKFEPKEGN